MLHVGFRSGAKCAPPRARKGLSNVALSIRERIQIFRREAGGVGFVAAGFADSE